MVWYWESTPAALDSASFCFVSGGGNANYMIASYTDGGVSPAFCVR